MFSLAFMETVVRLPYLSGTSISQQDPDTKVRRKICRKLRKLAIEIYRRRQYRVRGLEPRLPNVIRRLVTILIFN